MYIFSDIDSRFSLRVLGAFLVTCLSLVPGGLASDVPASAEEVPSMGLSH